MPPYSNHTVTAGQPLLTVGGTPRKALDDSYLEISPAVQYPITTIPEHTPQGLATIQERRVAFERCAQVFDTLHLDDYTPEEIKATWYDEDEMFRTRQDVRATVRWNWPSQMRGLEAETEQGHREQQAAYLNSLYFVLAEQGRQRQIGRNDPLALASMYASSSIESKKKARDIALKDAAAAEEVYKSSRGDTQQVPFGCEFLFDPSKWFPKNNKSPLV